MRLGLFGLAAAAICFLQEPSSRGWSDDREPLPIPKIAPPVLQKPSALMAVLDEIIDRRDLAEPMTFAKAIDRINAILARRGKSLPVRINFEAFKEELPETPDFASIEVVCPEQPARFRLRHLLAHYLESFPERNACFFVGPGCVEVTTRDRTLPAYRLATSVTLQVRSRPLFLVLEDLFEQTGVSIVVDARFAQRARLPVTATFADTVKLGDALVVLLNMADLRMVTVGEVVYVTSPQNANRVLWERPIFGPQIIDGRRVLQI